MMGKLSHVLTLLLAAAFVIVPAAAQPRPVIDSPTNALQLNQTVNIEIQNSFFPPNTINVVDRNFNVVQQLGELLFTRSPCKQTASLRPRACVIGHH
jgi:hypothetical protein